MRLLRVFSISFAIALGFVCTYAQDDDPIKVDTTIVRLNIGVVDERGRPVTSLNKSNFTLYEDGVKQDILSFVAAPAPFSVVMLLDMSGSTKSFRQNIQLSAARFLDALGPDDRVAVVEFYSKVNLLNNFTTNRNIAATSISLANGAGDTNLYKALQFSLEMLSKEGNRRKAIVVLTDGVDTPAQDADRKAMLKATDAQIPTFLTPEANQTLIRILNRSDAIGATIYPLALPTGDPARLADPTPRQIAMFKAARERLKIIADRSGGTLNSINRLEEMGKLYALVAADLRTLYTVEYEPINEGKDGSWRSIKVEVSNPDLIIRSRQGYFAK